MSTSPDRRTSTNTFAQSVSDAFHVLGKTLSRDSHAEQEQKDRSVSRGREGAAGGAGIRDSSRSRGRDPLISTGRGGAGNIIHSPERTGPDAAELETIEKARERSASRMRSSGRGGAGNMAINDDRGRAASKEDAYEAEVRRKHAEAEANVVHSSGRGGAGNIVGSRSPSRNPASRSPSRQPMHSTGRGGAGNMISQSLGVAADQIEHTLHHNDGGVHSTGRGGYGGMATGPEPPIEHGHTHPGQVASSGRGGAGNIH